MQYGFVITNAYGCIQLAAELRAPVRVFFVILGLDRIRMSWVLLTGLAWFGFEFEIPVRLGRRSRAFWGAGP